MEVLCADVHKQRSRYNVLQESLNNLDIEIAHLLKTNDQKSKSIDSLSQTNLEKNTYIASIKNNINELKSKMLNLTSTCKNTTDELSKEITTIKMQVDSRNEAIKTEKSKMEKYMEKLEMEEKTKFDERKLQQEKEIENRKESKEAVSDQVKQLSIKLERSTLEVDILLRKIKTAKELISSLKIEYQSKAQKLNNFKYQAKRQIDETSDSSFDGSVPFHERMSMTKKKKNKLQFH